MSRSLATSSGASRCCGELHRVLDLGARRGDQQRHAPRQLAAWISPAAPAAPAPANSASTKISRPAPWRRRAARASAPGGAPPGRGNRRSPNRRRRAAGSGSAARPAGRRRRARRARRRAAARCPRVTCPPPSRPAPGPAHEICGAGDQRRRRHGIDQHPAQPTSRRRAPSWASTTAISAICSAVLSLLTKSGSQRMDLGQRRHQQEAADDQHVAEHDEDHQPVGQAAGQAERHVHADQQRLVGDRVEQRAELGALVEALGDEAVDRVGQRRRRRTARRRRRDRPTAPARWRAARDSSRPSVIRLGRFTEISARRRRGGAPLQDPVRIVAAELEVALRQRQA